MENVAGSLARHVQPHARLVLALSGGLDSVALLHVLVLLRDKFSYDLQAVHVHHGLSPHADDWADFCARLCAFHAVPLSIHRVHVAHNDPAGTEAAARRERRCIFGDLDADFLITAHHQNDQAETLLLQLLRGAGPKGMAAMAEVQGHSGWRAMQLRPLLSVARPDILAYAQQAGLTWVEDESNQDVRYRRNALRHQIMPLLATHFPGVGATLSRAAALQAEAAGLLDNLARLDGEQAIHGDRLDCAALAGLSLARARNLLRHFIEQHGQPMPNGRRLNEALHQLLDARQDARVCVNLGEAEIRRFRGGAYLVPARMAAVQAAIAWQGEPELDLKTVGKRVTFMPSEGVGVRRALLDSCRVELRLRQGRERIRLVSGGPHRSLKNLLQESAIPSWERDRLPLLFCDDRLVWAAGIGCDWDSLAKPGEAGIVLACR